MRGKSLTPEDIAALMGDDLQENNGLKPGLHFSEALNNDKGPKFDSAEAYRSYVLPIIKSKKTVTESWYPEPVQANPTPRPAPPPKPIPTVSSKPIFGETERKLEL